MSKHDTIIEAGLTVFLRYGIGKTTMADIAGEAGLSRQTVYNLFENKDAVLRAVIAHQAEATARQMFVLWDAAENLDAVLDALIEYVPVTWFKVIASSPNAEGLMEGLHAVSKEEEERFAAHVKSAMTPHLQRFVGGLAGDDAKTSQFVDFVFSSIKMTKHGAADIDAVRDRAALQKQAILAMVAAGV